MSSSVLRPHQRARRHGAVLGPADRRALERSGWRTTLEYRENHVRSLDGRLLHIEPVWIAEAERYDAELSIASASGATPEEAWEHLRGAVESRDVRTLRRVRLAT